MRAEADVRLGASRLTDLYRLHADAAVRLAHVTTGDRAVAEDIVQDAFIKLSGPAVQ
jgi:DNA-directed RNA polymerase specialized sigma24 family protein